MKKNIFYVTIVILIITLWELFLSVDLSFARAWWGWSSSGWWWIIGLAIAWIYIAIMKIRKKKMMNKAQTDLKNALQVDSSWNETELKKVSEDVFYKYQNAWTNKNLESVKDIFTNSYYQEISKVLSETLQWKKNILKNISLQSTNLMSVKDWIWKDWDMFVMEMNASMIDYTIDENSWNFILSTLDRNDWESDMSYSQRAQTEAWNFTEYWVFMRSNLVWKLHNIKQSDSIIKDIMNMNENDLKEVLKREENSSEVDDSTFYK